MSYQRALLKLSGEALQGQQGYGIDPKVLADLSAELAEVHATGTQLGLVLGGREHAVGSPVQAPGWTVSMPITWVCSPP